MEPNLSTDVLALGRERSAIRELFEYGRAARARGEKICDLSLGNPAVPTPEAVTATMAELISSEPSLGLHGYTSAPGLPETRGAIAATVKDALPELTYVTCGAAAALVIAIKALITKKRPEIVIPAPFFPEYRVFVSGAGGRPVVVPHKGSDFDLDVDGIADALTHATRAVIINSPNNPSGRIYSGERLEELSRLLDKKSAEYGERIYIISDEPYREIYYGAKPPFIPDFYPHTVICNSFSKSLSLPGERIGYLTVFPRADGAGKIFDAVCGAGRMLGYVCAPSLMQKVIAKHAGRSCSVSLYRENRNLLCSALLKIGFDFVSPDGAFYLLVRSPDGRSQDMSDRAKKLGLLIVPGDSFGCPEYARAAFCVSKETIRESIPLFSELKKTYE